MKTLSVLIFTLFQICARAEYYQFNNSNGTYNPLQNPTIITSDFLQESYNLNLGETFKVFGVEFACNSTQPLIVEPGFGAIRAENTLLNKMFSVDGFVSVGLKKRDVSSEISYTIEGISGQKLLKVQWKNMTLQGGDPANDFVNFQIWLKQSGEIEIHMGAIQVSSNPDNVFLDNSDGPSVGIFLSTPNFSTVYETQFLTQSPSDPQVDKLNIFAPLGGIPSAYHVYSFSKKAASSVAVIENFDIGVYPQPAVDRLFLSSKVANEFQVEIYDLKGKLMYRTVTDTGKLEVDVSSFTDGIYVLKCFSVNQNYCGKMIKMAGS